MLQAGTKKKNGRWEQVGLGDMKSSNHQAFPTDFAWLHQRPSDWTTTPTTMLLLVAGRRQKVGPVTK